MQIKPMTIGELRLFLSRMEPTAKVRYDFVYMFPHLCHSWRGDYSQPAIGFRDISSGCEQTTVQYVRDCLKSLTEDEFTGWKGGEYRYDDDAILHVANASESANTVIVNVTINYGEVILHTAFLP
jgi:hypothetical protein